MKLAGLATVPTRLPSIPDASPGSPNMVKQRKVAARYAHVLFSLAKERNEISVISRDMATLVSIYLGSPALREFLARPSLPPAAKRAVATEIGRRSGLSNLAVDFFALIVKRQRAPLVAVMADKYEKLVDADLRRLRGRVRSAIALDGDERERLRATLTKRFQVDEVVLEEVVDPTLLGGLVVETDTMILDASLSRELDTLRWRLASGTS